MQTIFFKQENHNLFYKNGETWTQIFEITLGECVGKIVTEIVSKTYSSQLVNEIESNSEHPEFENYWTAIKNAHSTVHDDLTEFDKLLQAASA
jgi:hypothetical protein